ncbi:hypothetical protein INF26_06675 [Olsenella sp. DSM 107455]|uniref:Uncharacterized protein n=1 Tax=Thermophilibacter gallinarum TaxID=2779357 RepID=A0ABR9QTY5_9ACTN|nr:hypothetical protein [Thermophilibacter gallinarum]MBE5024532.1 hypothetical protein [Thermophilibacter gallinarum]
MNLIQRELEHSKAYALEIIRDSEQRVGRQLVKLSLDNVARVEKMIEYNSEYMREDGELKELEKLGKALRGEITFSRDEYRDIIYSVVRRVNRKYSTRMSEEERDELTDRLCEMGSEWLYGCLMNPKKDNYELVTKLSDITKSTGSGNGRRNKSFASKFCHYACYSLFEGKPEQDNYSPYDSVVKKALPLYVEYYGLNRQTQHALEDYATYQQCIDDVIRAAGGEISRNGLDHLLWYYFKGRI